MKHIVPGLVLLILALPVFGQTAAKVSPTVLEELHSAKQAERIPVLVRLISPVDLDQEVATMNATGVSVQKRPARIQQLLQDAHGRVQQEVLAGIPLGFRGQYKIHSQMWLVNMLHLDASPSVIDYLRQQTEVISIHHLNDFQVIQDEPIQGQASRRNPGGIETGHIAINALAMWSLGYSGHGQRALIYDTGIQPEHPAVRERFIYHYTPGKEGWFGVDRYYPGDKENSHGTHVAGIVLGLDPATNDTIGVAPGGRFMSTDPIVSDLSKIKGLPTYIQVYEWAFNPDGDTSTFDDIPVVVNNSWGLASTDTTLCNSFASDMFDALEAASIGVVFSAGNNGPGTATTGRPAFINSGLTNVFAVGALIGDLPPTYPIASFSSRGPTICPGTGSLKIKPEVSAPGFGVRSAVGTDDYASYNGTSMAAPHVTGAFLLLKEAFPYLTSRSILEALYFSAVDLGPAGEDNTYGMGIIDVKAAFDTLAKTHSPVPPQPRINDLVIVEILEPAFTYYCDSSFTVRAVVANHGINAAYDPVVRLIQGEGVRDSLTLDSLVAGAMDTVEFQFTGGLTLGENELAVRIDWAQGTVDYDIVDNQRMVRFDWRGLETLTGKDYYYHFDSISTLYGADLYIDGEEDFDTWFIDSTGTDYPGDQALVMPFGEYLPRDGQVDYLYFPRFEEAELLGAQLTFKHFYRRRSTIFADSFMVQQSMDCGGSWQTIYALAGDSLVTSTIADPGNPGNWRDDTVLISGLVRFKAVNDYGGDLYIDDINFSVASVGLETPERMDFDVAPNPSNENVQISWNWKKDGFIQIWSADGRMMLQQQCNSRQHVFNVSDWTAGIYFIQLQTEDGVAVRQLVVGR